VYVTCARDLCLRENTDYLTDAELRVEPPYAELRAEPRAEPCAEPLYAELRAELRVELCAELRAEPLSHYLINQTPGEKLRYACKLLSQSDKRTNSC